MVHDELEDFASPVLVRPAVEEDVYDNERYNNEESESESDEMDYNYDDEYFYWWKVAFLLFSFFFLNLKYFVKY